MTTRSIYLFVPEGTLAFLSQDILRARWSNGTLGRKRMETKKNSVHTQDTKYTTKKRTKTLF